MKVIILLLIISCSIFAQNEVSLGISKGFEKIDIFVDVLKSDKSELKELTSVLKWDLNFSGYFRQSDSKDYSDMNPIVYSVIGNWVIDSIGRLTLEGKILDAATKSMLMQESFSGDDASKRVLVHRFAAYVVEQLIGEKTSFLSTLLYAQKDGAKYYIRMCDIDGYNDRVIVSNNSINISPTIDNTKTKLAYVSYKNGSPHLYLLNLTNGKEENIAKEFDYAGSPAFSMDGKYIAFSASIDGNTDIYIYDVNKKTTRRVTRHWAIDTQPSFSPTGFELSFTSDRGGTPQIYTINSDGTIPSRLSWQGGDNENSAWSVDGTKVAYASFYMGAFRIVVKDIISGDEMALPSMAGSNESPSWAATGRHIILERNLGDRKDLSIINIETLDNFILGKRGGSNFSPYWSK